MASASDPHGFLVSKDVVVPLTAPQPVVLGRDPAAANFVLSDERVSRVHAMILFRDGQFLVKDLNSSNGTFLNGRRVTGSAPIRAGDRIGITPFSLEFVQPLSAAESSAHLAEGRNKFAGSIATLPITDLIQLLNATQQSGLLCVTDASEKQADLVIVDGEIEQANYDGLTGETAVYALLRARRGRFEFTKLERAPIPTRVHRPPHSIGEAAAQTHGGERPAMRRTLSMLLEGARQIDESSGPDTAHLNASGATTRDSSTSPGLSPLGGVIG